MNSCEKCVFRLNDEVGRQNGCRVGRLEHYAAQTPVLMTESGYCVIPGRLCGMNAHRAAVPDGQNLDELAARIRRDLSLRVRWVVACGRRLTDPDRLVALALAAQTQAGGHVQQVHVVLPDRKTQKQVARRLGDECQLPWATRWLTDPERADDPFACLVEDMTADPTDCQYAVLLWADDGLPSAGLLADLDGRVNDQMEQVLYGDEPWGAVVSTHVFVSLGHSADQPFPARLEMALQEAAAPTEDQD